MKSNITYFIGILVFSMFILPIQAQNLVPNASFEYHEDCPELLRTTDKNTNLMPHWTWPTLNGTSDYFHACSTSGMTGVPNNQMGSSPAKQGKGYVGLILKTKKHGGLDYREYIQAKLNKPLEKDKLYCVSMFYRLANCATFSIDRIGIYFADHEINIPTDKVLDFNPQLETPEGIYLDNDNEWEPLYNIYKAKGDEKFILIGNFRNDALTSEKTQPQASGCDSRKDYAYYYIDSVQVMQLNWECEPCVCIPQDLKLTVTRDDCFNGGANLTASVSGGTEPYHNFHWDDKVTTKYYEYALTGKHTATITDDWGCTVSKTIEYDCGQPLKAKVTDSGYTGNDDGFINITITGGIKPYEVKWSNGATTQNASNLPLGTHVFTITDAQGAQYTDSVKFEIPPLVVAMDKHYTNFNDGYIHLKVKGGLPPYTYQWSTGDTTQNLDSLGAGTYIYVVKDTEDRMATDTIRFVAPIKAHVEKGFTFEEDGFINLTVSGGCKPYTYKWSNGKTTEDVKFLDNGLYRFTIKGSCGKTYSDTVRIKGNIILNNILFKSGSSDLLEESFPELDRVVAYMKRKDKIKVQISGHTDNVGSDKLNQKLSENRAKSVVEYLVEQGIAEERLKYVGFGEEKPIADNDTKEGKAKNRRVEFDILDE